MTEQTPPQHLLNQRLQEIREIDAAAGGNLQMCPAAWSQRRELLEHIAAMEVAQETQQALVVELSSMMEPLSGGATDLAEILRRMKIAQEIQAAVRAHMAAAGVSVTPREPDRDVWNTLAGSLS